MAGAIKHPAWIVWRQLDAPTRERQPAAHRPIAVNSPGTLAAALDDARLLRRIARRDREAFGRLYDRHAAVLYSTAMRVLNHPDEAGDVLHEVFVQIWDESPAYEPALGKPFNWALTLTRHKAIERLRARQGRYSFFAEITGEKEVEAGDTVPGRVFTRDQVALVRGALAAVPYEQRQAIELAYLGGMTQDEIAESLGQPLGTITGRVRRGLLRLREGLRAHL